MTRLALQTRRLADVDNFCNMSAPTAGEIAKAANLRLTYIAAIHRPTPVCYSYNCHGLTFSARRTEINASADVVRILKDDDYDEVARVEDVLAGDVIIYFGPDGDMEHSGIVVENDRLMQPRVPKILSKWGSAHEVVHAYNYCPYSLREVKYYRVVK